MAQKREHWHQNNPKDQSLCLLMALEGHISNVQDERALATSIETKTQWILDDLRYLHANWLKGSWE